MQSMYSCHRPNVCPPPSHSYVTTIHATNSAVLKLSKLTRADTVYRGFQGTTLPRSFFVADRFGVKGGIEVSAAADPARPIALMEHSRASHALRSQPLGSMASHRRPQTAGWLRVSTPT